MRQKRFVCLLLVMLLLVSSFSGASAAGNNTKIFVNGQQLSFDVEPVIVEGTTLAPMRAIFEGIGAEVQWDQATKTATGTKDGSVVQVQIGNEYGYKDGQAYKLLQPAQLINDRTMIPLRFVSESLNCDVQWDGATKTITITTSDVPLAPPASETELPEENMEQSGNGVNWSGAYYATESGKKYHYLNPCGNGTYYAITWEEVESRGLEACDKCVR